MKILLWSSFFFIFSPWNTLVQSSQQNFPVESWIGTYAGRGNGNYQSELASALRAITGYLKRFALSSEIAIVRLDGPYGDAAAVALLQEAGVHLVTRGRGYRILEHPHMQQVLAHPPTAQVTQVSTTREVELFDGGWLDVLEGSLLFG